jgi:hypothetical protein
MYGPIKELMAPLHKTTRRYVYRAARYILEEGYEPYVAADICYVLKHIDAVNALVDIYESDEYADWECSVAA